MPQDLVGSLPGALLELSVLLAVAVFVGLFSQRARIPLTVVLTLAGILIVARGGQPQLLALLDGEGFEQVLVTLFLPILVFEAAIGLSTREFLRNLVVIFVLASVALALSAAMIGLGLHALLGIPLVAAWLFGVLSSATDPVAVVAVFRELGVPRRLMTLVEGESLLNDGVAIVLTQVLIVVALGGRMTPWQGVWDFVEVFLGGVLIGVVVGALAALVLPFVQPLPAAALSVAVAYGGFVLAEAALGFSGVMATVAAGVVLGGLLDSRAEPAVRGQLHQLWGALSFIANALLFLFIGLLLDVGLLVDNLPAVGVAILAVLLARPLAIVPLVRLLERVGAVPRIGRRSSAVLVWGGLRGGVALALALALPIELAERELFIAMITGVVLTTLLLNATTMPALIHALGLDEPDDEERYLEAIGRLAAIAAIRTRLETLGFTDALVDAHLQVAAADAGERFERARLTGEQEVRLLVLRGLHIERETYQDLHDAQLLAPISTRALMQEIDDEIEEVELGQLRVHAQRRSELPWLGRFQRWLVGLLPPPIGVDLAAAAHVEVAARRLAARRAGEELERFRAFAEVEGTSVDEAKRPFTSWERSAAATLEALEQDAALDERLLARRQAKALGLIAARETLRGLVGDGVLPASVAARADARLADELGQIGT